MKWSILILSVLLLIAGGFLVFISFMMSIDEPGHGGKFEIGRYLIEASLLGFVVGLVWPSRKK